MRNRLVGAVAILLLCAPPANAHRLDEYLQATTISIGRDRIRAQLRLTPGVAVFATVLAAIDLDSDGALSAAERRSYAERVLADLSLAIDGTRLPLRLSALSFASIAEMKAGRGEIRIGFDAVVPPGGVDRRLTFENHHRARIAEYLVNTLVPGDPDVRVTGQRRSYEQASYELDYAEGTRPVPPAIAWWSGTTGWLGAIAVLVLAPLGWLRWRTQGVATTT